MKNAFQTACEKMTDAEIADWYTFVTDSTKGAAARLWCIESSLAFQIKTRGLPIAQNASTLSLEQMVLIGRSNQAAHVNIVKGLKNAMVKLDNEDYAQTVRAHCEVNQFFGDKAQQAAIELDEGFFRRALEAIRDLKRKRGKTKAEAGESKMILHIQAALTILHNGDARGENPLRKVTKKWLMTEIENRLTSPFSDTASWQAFFKRPEISPFVRQDRSGGRPKTSGKGR